MNGQKDMYDHADFMYKQHAYVFGTCDKNLVMLSFHATPKGSVMKVGMRQRRVCTCAHLHSCKVGGGGVKPHLHYE